jgi:hypothetical protein
LTYQANKLMKRVKMTNKENAIVAIQNGANALWNAACFCKKCDSKPFTKIDLVEFSAKADELGLDLSDAKQLQKMNHLVLQAVA